MTPTKRQAVDADIMYTQYKLISG